MINRISKAKKVKNTVLYGDKRAKSVKSSKGKRTLTKGCNKAPLFPKKVLGKSHRLSINAVIKGPLCTETVSQLIENKNTLVFLCDPRATKPQIKEAIKLLYNVLPQRVNTLIRPDGVKKAFAMFSHDIDATIIAGQAGYI